MSSLSNTRENCQQGSFKLRNVFLELGVEEFKKMRENIKNEMILIKFSATWCGPCKKIKSCCEEWFGKLPSSVIIFDIDIDETMDLYMAFKKWKMVDGVPAMLAFHTRPVDNKWFIPDDSITGGNLINIQSFFLRCEYKGYSFIKKDYYLMNSDDPEYIDNIRQDEEDNNTDPKEKKQKDDEENVLIDHLIYTANNSNKTNDDHDIEDETETIDYEESYNDNDYDDDENENDNEEL